jgi:small-conductance mechanosensitive channel
MAVFNIIVQIIDQEGLINTTLSSLILDVFMFKFSAKQVILIIFYGYAVITFAEIWKNSSKMVINATKMSDDDKMIFTKVLRYIGYFVLILFFLKIAAIDTKQIAFITGALSFGVGFGLQKIFANFISGIFVLFEKKIKLDDLVELSNGKIGYVKKIDIRSTVLQDFSGQSIVVPNEEFLIQIITNMTLFSRRHGVVALFCVNHDADLNFVLELCKKVGTSICGEGNFSCRINEVRDYGVEIYNRIWINKIDDEIMDVWKLKSEVIKNIQAELYKHNIHFAKRISFTNQNV